MKKKAAALCMAFAMMCGVGATVYAENTDMPDELAYVYVDEAETPVSEGQNIVVSFENENLAVASARLQYQIEENTGGEIEASQILHNTLLFVQQYDSEAEAGNYSLTGLSYTLEDGTEKQIDFTSQEIAASYQVLADEAMEIQDLDSTEEVSVYSMNDDGAIVQETGDSAEQTIGTVLEEARAVEPASPLLRTGRREVVVAIGAGHDSRHVGARSEDGRLREESLNLKVAKYCQEELSKYTGVRVVMLRDKESCPYNNATLSYCLNQRVIDAANAGAQLYVDLHFNAGGGNGAEVYYPNKSWRPHLSEEGEDVSVKILNQLEALGLANRGAKIKNTTLAGEDGEYPDGSKSDYFTTNVVAKELGITGIIVEHAFLDGAQDVSRLRDEAFLKQLGVADAVGIARKYGLTRVESAGDTADGAENGGNPPENSVPGNTEEDSAQYLANFYDVKVGDWYYDYAKYVYEEGLIDRIEQ